MQLTRLLKLPAHLISQKKKKKKKKKVLVTNLSTYYSIPSKELRTWGLSTAYLLTYLPT